MFVAARALGLSALAVTDHNILAGIARAYARAEEAGIRSRHGIFVDSCEPEPDYFHRSTKQIGNQEIAATWTAALRSFWTFRGSADVP